MDQQAVFQQLTELFREIFDDDGIVLSRETVADDIEDWDSVTNIEMLVAAERAFGVKLHTGEIAGLRNVGELVDRISAHLRPAVDE
jgi:acyl carrier protein